MPEIKQSMQSLLSNCNFGALTFFLSAPPLLAGALKWCQPTFHLNSLSTTGDIGTVFICHYYLLIRINPLTVLVYVLFGYKWNSEQQFYLLYAFRFCTHYTFLSSLALCGRNIWLGRDINSSVEPLLVPAGNLHNANRVADHQPTIYWSQDGCRPNHQTQSTEFYCDMLHCVRWDGAQPKTFCCPNVPYSLFVESCGDLAHGLHLSRETPWHAGLWRLVTLMYRKDICQETAMKN